MTQAGGRWVPVTERLPPLGVAVYVTGRHVPPDTGNPRARLCACAYGHDGLHFESNQWRGMVGVTHWWEEVPGAADGAISAGH